MKKIIVWLLACGLLLSGCEEGADQYTSEEVLTLLEEYYSPYYVKETENGDTDEEASGSNIETYDVYEDYDEEYEIAGEKIYEVKVNLITGQLKQKIVGESGGLSTNLEQIEKDVHKNNLGGTEENDKNSLQKEKGQQTDYFFGDNFITGYGFDILLKEDGSVLARGINTNGELGNGTLTDSDEWQEVEEIDNVKQIACSLNLWDEEIGASIYALKEDGTVWTWGAEKVIPEQIPEISDIDKLILKNRGFYGGYGQDFGMVHVYLLDEEGHLQGSLSEGAYYPSNYGEIKVNDVSPFGYVSDREIYIEGTDHEVGTLEGYTVYDMDDQETTLGTIVKMCGQASEDYPYFLSEEGALYYYSYQENCFEQFGNNIKDYYKVHDDEDMGQDAFDIALSNDGEVYTSGDNDYGEVGNGTTDKFSEWWTVDVPPINSIFTPFDGSVYAIDEENNLWAWGKGYDTLPQLLYNLNDVANEN